MTWRWWLKVGMNETPRMRPGWWLWVALRAEMLASLRAMMIGTGEVLVPVFRAYTAQMAAAAESLQRLTALVESHVPEPLDTLDAAPLP